MILDSVNQDRRDTPSLVMTFEKDILLYCWC